MTTNGLVGWLGTGRMGEAMAGRLVDGGASVMVWNRTRSKTERLAAKGARVADTIGELGASDVVFVMVSTPDDLREVILGPDGLLGSGTRPGVLVDCSTVSADVSGEIRDAAGKAGVEFLAAPVSGNPHVVAEGRGCLVVSGPRKVFDDVEPYLAQVAGNAIHVGDGEESRLVKLCHNLYLGMMVQALVEVTSLAEKGGIDRAVFLEFLNGTVLGSDWVRKRTKDLVQLNWTPTFTTELLRKDFDLGLRAARDLEVPMPIGSMVYQLIQVAIGHGLRDQDFLSLYEIQGHAAGLLVDEADS
jgi:3-hydroxyisobutyrate dehydrogenase-like beta-hydroxyacid dehydrogenase